MRDQFIERRNVEVPLGNPADHLDISQAARAPFDVGFELVGGIVVAMMAGALLGALRFEESIRWPYIRGRDRLLHLLEQRFRAVEEAGLDESSRDSNVVCRFLAALLDRSDTVADFQPDVPERREKIRQGGFCCLRHFFRGEHHDVDIGIRV
jgi:hypothetical protein